MNVAKALTGELNEVIAKARAIAEEGCRYWKAEVASSSAKDKPRTECRRRVIALAPRQRGSNSSSAQLLPRRRARRTEACTRGSSRNTAGGAPSSPGSLRRLDASQAVRLASPTLSGSEIAMKAQGKVASSTSGHCAARASRDATMKKLYAEYKDKASSSSRQLDEKEAGRKAQAFVAKEGSRGRSTSR